MTYHHSTNPPTYDQIAQMLKDEGITKTVISKQAIGKRMKKLRDQNLLGLEDDSPDKALRHAPKDLAERAEEIRKKF